MANRKNRGGLVFETIQPGAFYQGVLPGGFTDATTSIHIPGPKVALDEVNKRTVTKVTDLPDPVQIPHLKEVYEFKDKDRKIREKSLVPFDRDDEFQYHQAFQMALSTGIIREVSDEDVQKFYPEAWAKKQDRIVYTQEISVTPMIDLIEQAQEIQAKERNEAARSKAEATKAAEGNKPETKKEREAREKREAEERAKQESGQETKPPTAEQGGNGAGTVPPPPV